MNSLSFSKNFTPPSSVSRIPVRVKKNHTNSSTIINTNQEVPGIEHSFPTSKNIKRNPSEIPKAKLTPIPPLLLNEETETPIKVKTKAEKGKLHLL